MAKGDLVLSSELEGKNNTVWHHATVSRARRERLNNHRSAALWFTGLSGAGKSTLAHAVEEELHRLGCRTFVFDGDNVRHGLCSDLCFTRDDRTENIRRIGEMVRLFVDAGIIAMTAFISPFRSDRQKIRDLLKDDFIEIYCRCPLKICEQRDVKGHYHKARAGKIKEFTGISSPYEEPEKPELALDTGNAPLEECVERIITLLIERGIVKI
ncbi:MAG: adenylyl-sulfate kinase [Nitrospiraceae bacterium]|nr:MAG: adenylyl-sulfate kinase [Nitrospiraceae bacterium]